MEQRNNKKKEFDEIHKSSYEFRTNLTLPQYSHKFINVKFVRISREFRPICQ